MDQDLEIFWKNYETIINWGNKITGAGNVVSLDYPLPLAETVRYKL